MAMANLKIVSSAIILLGVATWGRGDDSSFITPTEGTPIVTVSLTTSSEEANDEITTASYELETTSSSEGSDLLYLEYEYGNLDREVFWSKNQYRCANGKLHPSSYLQNKYDQCAQIHMRHQNPNCTKNCRMAITMLLGPNGIPSLDLFNRYFEIVLPENQSLLAREALANCFAGFGSDEVLLDPVCEKSQPFFACVDEIEVKLTC